MIEVTVEIAATAVVTANREVAAEAAQTAAAGGGERSRDRHVKRGKMLPRERIEQLVTG